MIDEIIKRVNPGLTYDELSREEKEELNVWLSVIQKGSLSVEKVRDYISGMRRAVEEELSNYKNKKEKDIYLKARLRNYLLLEAFLSTPERARQKMEEMIAGIAPRNR